MLLFRKIMKKPLTIGANEQLKAANEQLKVVKESCQKVPESPYSAMTARSVEHLLRVVNGKVLPEEQDLKVAALVDDGKNNFIVKKLLSLGAPYQAKDLKFIGSVNPEAANLLKPKV